MVEFPGEPHDGYGHRDDGGDEDESRDRGLTFRLHPLHGSPRVGLKIADIADWKSQIEGLRRAMSRTRLIFQPSIVATDLQSSGRCLRRSPIDEGGGNRAHDRSGNDSVRN